MDPVSKPKTFKVATLGCRTNQYESAAYAKQLRALGYIEAEEGQPADLCIVNTCTVTEGADRSSRHQIRKFASQNPGAELLVTGCLAERVPEEVAALPGVTHLVPNTEKEKLLARLLPEEELPEFSIDAFGGHTRAFVKVQDGCNSFCTYCIIPYVRGRSRSRPAAEIIREVETLVAAGYQEIVLTGINIGDFENGPEFRLADLVRMVDSVEGVKRLRLSSIDPDEVDEPLTAALLEGRHTCPSLHIVLQSGSNAILKRMNRKYTKQIFLDTIERLKLASPDFTFTTDVIVGFPGENEQDFEETLDLIRQVQFAKVHMFPYSPRKRTRAALFPNQIPAPLIEERKQKVLRLAEQMAYELRNRYIGRTLEVLLEEKEKNFFAGHSQNFLRVLVEDEQLHSNTILSVECLENRPEGLVGRRVNA